jgi:hypothetical protein
MIRSQALLHAVFDTAVDPFGDTAPHPISAPTDAQPMSTAQLTGLLGAG